MEDHLIEPSRIDPAYTKCTDCNGTGIYEDTGCCGIPTASGECCQCEPIKKECRHCEGTGLVEYEDYHQDQLDEKADRQHDDY